MVSTKPQILIVDDEPAVCDVLKDDLSEHGYLCTTALDGLEAFTELEKQEFDVVLLDIKMPGMLLGQQSISPVTRRDGLRG